MKLKELLLLMGVVKSELRPGLSPEAEVIIMPEETDGFSVKDAIYFKETQDTGPQMWIIMDEEGDRWLTTEEVGEEEGPPDDAPLCEREGDMCSLPEVSGEPECPNPFCTDGMTEVGPCVRCSKGRELAKQKEKEKADVCETTKRRARQA